MASLNLVEAVNYALGAEMESNPLVVLLGEEVSESGGLHGAAEGLLDRFGGERVLEVPFAEGGLLGAAAGMAMYGLRPVAELPFAECLFPGLEQLSVEIARLRFRSGGEYTCPLVVRVPYGAGIGGGLDQFESPEAYLTHSPGLVVVAPSNAYDAVGLLRSALRGDDPVAFLEPRRLYRHESMEIPETDYEVPIGEAKVLRECDEGVSLITYGGMVPVSLDAAELAAEAGHEVEVVELRTLLPFDIGTVLASVVKTGRALVVTESRKHGGFGAELVATLAERALLHLEAPVERVAGLDAPIPYAREELYVPDSSRVLAAIERLVSF